MTGAETLTYIKSILKRTDKDAEVYESITDVIMDMRLRFHSEDFKAISSNLAITTIGDHSVALPSDFGHLIGDPVLRDNAADQEYNPPKKISIQTYFDKYGATYNTAVGNRLTGTPIEYCIYGGNILVGPAVDKTSYVLKIAYTTENETAVTSVTANVPFTDRYRKTVRYGVLREMYLLLENYQEAEVWGNLYESDLQKIVNNDQSNVRDDMMIAYNGV